MQAALADVLGRLAGSRATVLKEDFPSLVSEHQRRVRTDKRDSFAMSINRMVRRKAAQLPSQHQVAVVVSENLCVGNLLRVLEPVNPGIARYAGRKGILDTPAQGLNPPNRRVQDVYTLIAQLAIAVIPEEPSVIMEAVDIKGPFRRGPEPDVVVHRRRRVAVGRVADRRTQLALPGIDFAHFAEFSRFQEFDGALEVRRAPVLRAHLADPLVFAHRISDPLSIVDRLRQRLFDVDIFPRLARQDSDPRVPVVGGGDEDGVDVLVVEHPLELFGGSGRLALSLLEFRVDLVQNRPVNVAKSFELGTVSDRAESVISSLISTANQRHHDLIVGAERARVPI